LSDVLEGHVKSTFPWVTVTVQVDGIQRDISFLVDTGYNGELAVNRELHGFFGTSSERLTVEDANGFIVQRMLTQCDVMWCGDSVPADVVHIEGPNPLIGTELLSGHRLTVEFEDENDGYVSVEPI
jgi:predicted aspartyl protease